MRDINDFEKSIGMKPIESNNEFNPVKFVQEAEPLLNKKKKVD
jgi:hypothetical protein